ncbi:hypothetical protein ACWGIN_03130 [Streptomyces sp. NPDC054861]
MRSLSAPPTAPDAPAAGTGTAGQRRRIRRRARRRAVLVPVLLVLAALFGAGCGAAGPAAVETRSAASTTPDPVGEAHDTAESENAAPGRDRSRRRAAARGGRFSRTAPTAPRAEADAPLPRPVPRAGAPRCRVMRC